RSPLRRFRNLKRRKISWTSGARNAQILSPLLIAESAAEILITCLAGIVFGSTVSQPGAAESGYLTPRFVATPSCRFTSGGARHTVAATRASLAVTIARPILVAGVDISRLRIRHPVQSLVQIQVQSLLQVPEPPVQAQACRV